MTSARLRGKKETDRQKETPGIWKVNGTVSTSRRYLAVRLSLTSSSLSMALSFPSLILLLSIALSISLDLAAFPTTPVSNTPKLQTRFNHRLKMTAGTEREVKGIVQVCEVGAKRGNETERKGWRGWHA